MNDAEYHYDAVVAAIRFLDEYADDADDTEELRLRLVEVAGLLRDDVADEEHLRLGEHDVNHLLPDSDD